MKRAGVPFSPVAVVGHRGSGADSTTPILPENTLASFLAAVTDGASWIETDARATRDGRLVLAHDLSLRGEQVSAMTYEQALAAGAVDAEVLDALPAHVGVDLEVKTSLLDIGTSGTHAAAAAFVRKRRNDRPWLLSSFDMSAQMAAQDADVAFGALFKPDATFYESITSSARIGASVLKAHERSFWRHKTGQPAAAECLAAARGAGMQVMIWGATARTSTAARSFGVAALCVDDVPGTVTSLTAGVTVPSQTAPANLLRV